MSDLSLTSFPLKKTQKRVKSSCALGNFLSKHRTWSLLIKQSLHWRYNDHDGVSNHQPNGCLLNRLFRRRSKKTLKLRVTGLCVGNSPGTGEFPAQMASNAENVSIWWRHHEWQTQGSLKMSDKTFYLKIPEVGRSHIEIHTLFHNDVSDMVLVIWRRVYGVSKRYRNFNAV